MKTQAGSVEEFLEEPYLRKQLVSFVDNEVYEAKISLEEKKTGKSFQDYAKLLIKAVASPYSLDPLGCAKIKAAEVIIGNYLEAYKTGLRVNLIPSKWCPPLETPPGHPRENVLYAGHPVDPKTYIPVADFHRFMFEHKFCELLSILMHLGAKKITVGHVYGRSKGYTISSSVEGWSAKAGLEGGTEHNLREQIVYESELCGTESPKVPDNLIWYPYEPLWMATVDGCLRFGQKNFSLALEYHDDYGINAGLRMRAEKVGFDVGGEFERYEDTKWLIYGSF